MAQGCAPGSAWGLGPTFQSRSEAASQVSPLLQAAGVPRSLLPDSPPCWASCFELLAICRRQCAGLDAPGNKATKNSSQLTSTYFQERKWFCAPRTNLPPFPLRAGLYWQKPGGGIGEKQNQNTPSTNNFLTELEKQQLQMLPGYFANNGQDPS